MTEKELKNATAVGYTRPVADHDFVCGVCGEFIRAGTRHVKFVFKDNESRKFNSVRRHLQCKWEE